MSCTNPQPYFVPLFGGRPKPCPTDLPAGRYGNIGRLVYLPCGQCLACRRERRQDYTCLQLLESLNYDDNWFLTLTYDDDHLPDNKSLVKSHLSTFFQSLRKYCKYNSFPCRYFAVGEYGDKYKRPHYHASLFGLTPEMLGLQSDDSSSSRFDFLSRGVIARIKEGVYDENGNRYWSSPVISDRWPYGHHQIYRASRETFQYVAGYVVKKLSGLPLREFKASGLIPPYSIQSRPSIGYTWWKKNHHRLSLLVDGKLYNDCVDVPGMSWRLPRIFDKWLTNDRGCSFSDRLKQERVKAFRLSSSPPVPDRDDLARRFKHDEVLALRHWQQSTHRECGVQSTKTTNKE